MEWVGSLARAFLPFSAGGFIISSQDLTCCSSGLCLLMTVIIHLETPLTYLKSMMFPPLFYSVSSTTTTPSVFVDHWLLRPTIISVNSIWTLSDQSILIKCGAKPTQILGLSPYPYWVKQDYPTEQKRCTSSYILTQYLPILQEHSTGNENPPVAKHNPHIFCTEPLPARSMTCKTLYLIWQNYIPLPGCLCFWNIEPWLSCFPWCLQPLPSLIPLSNFINILSKFFPKA